MSIDQSSDVECFDIIKTTDTIRRVIEEILNTNEYNLDKIDHWSRQIVDLSQRSLLKMQSSFKTIVTTMIIPKDEEHLHISNACFWDFAVDGSTIIQWENDSMYCVVSAFALSLSVTAHMTV